MERLTTVRDLCEIDFRDDGNSTDFIVDGWSEPEPIFTWATGAQSTLELDGIPAGGDIILEMAVWPMVQPPEVPEQHLSVTVNEHLVGEISLRAQATLMCRIPTSALRADGRLTVTLHHPNAARPADVVAGNEDMRLLSFGFERIVVRATGPGAVEATAPASFARTRQDAILYGNCQVEILARAFNQCPSVSRQMRCHAYLSFAGAGEEIEPVPDRLMQRASVLLHQLGEWGRDSPVAGDLHQGAVIVHFPPVGSNALWPLARGWPKNDGRPVGTLPWTEHHGDLLALRLARAGLSRGEFIASYQQTDLASLTSLTRRHELDFDWLRRNEALSDIVISDFMQTHFATHRLFWMSGHASNFLYGELARRLAIHCARLGIEPFLSSADAILSELREVFAGPELHDGLQIPIHPQVAAALGLQWYDADYVYSATGLPDWTFNGYVGAIYDELNGGAAS